MKIAIVSTIENCSWAGTEEVWAQFALHAMNEGHEVLLLAHDAIAGSEQVAGLMEKGLQVLSRKPFRPVRAYLLKEMLYSDYRKFSTFGADVILINSGSLYDATNLPYVHIFLQKQNIPKIFFCHFAAETHRQNYSSQIMDFFQSMKQVIFVSQHNLTLAERQIAVHFNKSSVIMNQSKVFMNGALAWPSETTVQFACVARLETLWKGQDVLLQVLASEVWQQRDWHLNLYGEGADKAYIEELIKFYKLENKVTLHGYLKDIKAVWSLCHIKVMASRGEGTPLSVIEAMMCGRPSVVADVGGNREIISEGQTGWIAETATTHSFGKALELAWQNKESWRGMGLQAHEDAKALSQKNAPQQLLQALTDIVKTESVK